MWVWTKLPHAPLFEALVGPLVGSQRYKLSSLPRPGNTFRGMAALLIDAARNSCLVVVARSFIG